MSYTMNFQSSRVKDEAREETRKARKTILTKAKADYDRKKESEKHIDKKWMLPSVDARLDSDSKSKKHKKSKKKKKKKKSRKSESDDESSEEEWTEITTDETPPSHASKKAPAAKEAPAADEPGVRDEWMSLPGLFPCVTKERKQPEKRKDQDKMMLDTMGQSERELNPYWRSGGTGLPSEEKFARKVQSAGDRGADWLRRALTRAREQAADEGRSLEAVAAERWGSLEKLETLLAEAEARSGRGPANRYGGNGGRYRAEDRRNDEPREYDEYRRRRERDRRERDDVDPGGNEGRSFRRPREDEEATERNSDQREDKSDRLRGGHEEGGEGTSGDRPRTFRRPAGEEGGEGRRSDERRDSSRSGGAFRKPRGDDNGGTFKKPTDGDGERSGRDGRPTASSSSRTGNWRKRGEGPTETRREPPERSESTSSSSSSDEATSPVALSEREMNDLGAKLIKAEILGNEALATELKKKLDQANAIRSSAPTGSLPGSSDGRSEKEVVILTRTDSKGLTRPVSAATEPSGGRRRKQKAPTHDKEGKRVRYFADDDRLSLQEMFQNEKLNTVEDSNEMFATLAGKVKPNDDMAELFEERVSQQESAGKREARERSHAIGEFKRSEKALDSCQHCFDSKLMLKHLVIAIGTKVYVSLPPYQSLTEGHCMIAPLYHVPCATQLDEDVWAEVQSFRRALTAMFVKMDQDVVYIETATRLRNYPHMVLECVPMPTEIGHMAPIYFKKAILECETEWSTNRKLVDTMGRDVRRAIPKGLPYFSVDFGNEGGFAHVIEDESLFPKNFAQEIVGGMLDLDHNLWRKPRRENFDAQRKKVLQFAEWWKPFDFTAKPSAGTDSDSSD